MISAEHLIRLLILVVAFWLIAAFFVGHRIYTEIASVRHVATSPRLAPLIPPFPPRLNPAGLCRTTSQAQWAIRSCAA
jgi:hypothetical protein